MRHVRWAIVAALCIVVIGGTSADDRPSQGGARVTGEPEELTVYVPCGFIGPLGALRQSFVAQNPGVELNFFVEGDDVLAQRILLQGKRPDLVVASGTLEMSRFVEAGLIEERNRRPIAQYALVLYVPKGNSAGIEALADLRKGAVTHISLADAESTTRPSVRESSRACPNWAGGRRSSRKSIIQPPGRTVTGL